MRIVLVSSPGNGPAVHWSHGAAAELGAALLQAGAAVTWLARCRTGQLCPPPPPGSAQQCLPQLPPRSLHRAAEDNSDPELEAELARSLRQQPAAGVVHLGAGARGTPNVAWLAERMGSVPFASVRAAEVVCHRGDLIERGGGPCAEPLRTERCRSCCTSSWWRAPRADELQNRADLLAGSLLVAAAIFVGNAEEAALLQGFGVNARSIEIAVDATAASARILAALR